LQGLRESGARRIRTADLLGAMATASVPPSVFRILERCSVGFLSETEGGCTSIYAGICGDSGTHRHQCPTRRVGGSKLRIRASARLGRYLSDACRRKDLCHRRAAAALATGFDLLPAVLAPPGRPHPEEPVGEAGHRAEHRSMIARDAAESPLHISSFIGPTQGGGPNRSSDPRLGRLRAPSGEIRTVGVQRLDHFLDRLLTEVWDRVQFRARLPHRVADRLHPRPLQAVVRGRRR